MSERVELSVVLPVFNEEAVLSRLFERLSSSLPEVAEDPDNLHALHLLGVVYRHAQSNERARQMFERVLELEPDHPQAQAALEAMQEAASAEAASGTS